MPRDYDYDGPSSGKKKKKSSDAREDHDHKVAQNLQKHLQEEEDDDIRLSTKALRLQISKDSKASHRDEFGKGKSKESATNNLHSSAKSTKHRQGGKSKYPRQIADALEDLRE